MSNFIRKLLNIYKPELIPFLFCTVLLFTIRFSDIILENYAETAFLKRFGIKHLPSVYMVNAISAFFIIGIVASLQKRMKDLSLLAYVSIFCGASVVTIKLISPVGFKLILPLFYILKSQYEVILGLIFWNLANDIFNTRQSKRLFPPITAGGTLGAILASFLTPGISKLLGFEGLLWVYLFSMLVCSGLSIYMGKSVVLDPYVEPIERTKKQKKGFLEDLKLLKSLSGKYLVVKLLILLTLVPNMVIPILNYSFNFAADKQFATEEGLLAFFGYFKGIMNILSFGTLLFVGRLYNRFGLPIAMLIHPINYLISFSGLFWRMDAVVASYARISTTIIRNTINNPARAALMGILPKEGRAILRAFLRGGVVRLAVMSGSGLIYLVNYLLGPKGVPLSGAVLSLFWIGVGVILKLRYAEILSRSILEGSIDLKVMEMEDIENIFRDPAGKERLLRSFWESKGEDRIWYAKILRAIGEAKLNDAILNVLKDEDPPTKERLIELIDITGLKDIRTLMELAKTQEEGVLRAIVRQVARLSENECLELGRLLFEGDSDPIKKAYGIWLLYNTSPAYYRNLILSWLTSQDEQLIRAGLLAVEGSKDKEFLPYVKAIVLGTNSTELKAMALETLASLRIPGLNQILYPFLESKEPGLKKAALKVMEIHEPESVMVVMRMLLDKDQEVRRLAFERLRDAEYEDPSVLFSGIRLPTRQAREAIFRVLEGVEIRRSQVFRFVRENLKVAYQALLDSEAVERLAGNGTSKLLRTHLKELADSTVKDVIRVLASQVRDKEFKKAWKGIYSPNPITRGNALELLDTVIDRRVGRLLLPLLESTDMRHLKGIAQSIVKPPMEEDLHGLFKRLISSGDWVTVALATEFVQKNGHIAGFEELLITHFNSPYPCLRAIAASVLNAKVECKMEQRIDLSEKILMLRSIYLFQDLTVQELAAIAVASHEVEYPRGSIVFKEGDRGDSLYLVAKGKVAVIKAMGEDGSPEGIKLAEIGPGDYFGEMALIEDTVRSATIKTLEESIFLVLEKHEFTELVMEYPSIPLKICKILSARLRALQKKLTGQVYET